MIDYIKSLIKKLIFKKKTLVDRDILRKLLDEYACYNSQVYFIQIGSHDGISGDPLHESIIKNKWKGVLVEPVDYLFNKLKKNYERVDGLIFENAAIDEKSGERIFYKIKMLKESEETNLPTWYNQLSSFHKNILLNRECHSIEEYRIENIRDLIVETMVETITFDELLDKNNVSKFDVLHIDTEGHDYVILKNVNFNRIRPDIVIFEYHHLNNDDYESSLELLADEGYILYRFLQNMICLKSGLVINNILTKQKILERIK